MKLTATAFTGNLLMPLDRSFGQFAINKILLENAKSIDWIVFPKRVGRISQNVSAQLFLEKVALFPKFVERLGDLLSLLFGSLGSLSLGMHGAIELGDPPLLLVEPLGGAAVSWETRSSSLLFWALMRWKVLTFMSFPLS